MACPCDSPVSHSSALPRTPTGTCTNRKLLPKIPREPRAARTRRVRSWQWALSLGGRRQKSGPSPAGDGASACQGRAPGWQQEHEDGGSGPCPWPPSGVVLDPGPRTQVCAQDLGPQTIQTLSFQVQHQRLMEGHQARGSWDTENGPRTRHRRGTHSRAAWSCPSSPPHPLRSQEDAEIPAEPDATQNTTFGWQMTT